MSDQSLSWHDENLRRCAAIIAYCDDPCDYTEAAMIDACRPRQPALFGLERVHGSFQRIIPARRSE